MKRKMIGTTSDDYKHNHRYEVDAYGNGWAYEAYHPLNKSIYHKHEVINWIVQEEKSHCYPNCEKEYGVSGVPMHSHHLEGEVNAVHRKISNLRAIKNSKKRSFKRMDALRGSKHSLLKNKIIDKDGLTYQCPPNSTEVTSKCRQVGNIHELQSQHKQMKRQKKIKFLGGRKKNNKPTGRPQSPITKENMKREIVMEFSRNNKLWANPSIGAGQALDNIKFYQSEWEGPRTETILVRDPAYPRESDLIDEKDTRPSRSPGIGAKPRREGI
tara:strand:+ start:1491 stop:2300 length:810 start_codon:yes stop_codon:yes gene_type:complete